MAVRMRSPFLIPFFGKDDAQRENPEQAGYDRPVRRETKYAFPYTTDIDHAGDTEGERREKRHQ